ncbi:MAG: hypothetical protein AAGG38_04660 [Planctomycetota bacterium]
MTRPQPTTSTPATTDDNDDKTWVVLLVVFGLMGLGGPILACLLFWLI